VKIGIGRPKDASQVSGYVLNPFTKEEKTVIEDAIEKASKAVETVISEGIGIAMNRFNA